MRPDRRQRRMSAQLSVSRLFFAYTWNVARAGRVGRHRPDNSPEGGGTEGDWDRGHALPRRHAKR